MATARLSEALERALDVEDRRRVVDGAERRRIAFVGGVDEVYAVLFGKGKFLPDVEGAEAGFDAFGGARADAFDLGEFGDGGFESSVQGTEVLEQAGEGGRADTVGADQGEPFFDVG